MANCGQACPYNTLDGCKVKEHNAICPLTNMATPITEYRMTNADRIRAMSDEELAKFVADNHCCQCCNYFDTCTSVIGSADRVCLEYHLEWLKQPAEE